MVELGQPGVIGIAHHIMYYVLAPTLELVSTNSNLLWSP